EVFVELLGHITLLGGWDGITGIPKAAIGSFFFLSKTSYYYLTLALIGVSILIFYALYRSPIGKAWTAIGQSIDLAASVGINIFRYRMAAYVASGFTAGLSGSLYAHYMTYLVPSTFDITRSLQLAISAVVGGLRSFIAGPIIGTVIMEIFPELLRITDKYEPIFVGFLIILCTLFFRRGVLGSLPKLGTRKVKRIFEGDDIGNTAGEKYN
ncbi:MAG TPA: branched-chain amino acid ABC transporter permease, partial [Dehalococcoidia bacterium]|nr:branched-chain amino acid ABC transporter permease [Dehalococcoidia bacterium]